MALHTDLPIYRTGVQLLQLAVKAQAQMPRQVKRHLGDKISAHCMEMLDRMALNAVQWAAELGMSANTLRSRLRLGWSVERALTEPLGAQGGSRCRTRLHRRG